MYLLKVNGLPTVDPDVLRVSPMLCGGFSFPGKEKQLWAALAQWVVRAVQ